MKCTDTAYISDLSVKSFSVTHALTKVFNVVSEKESLVIEKNATILKFEECTDYGNGNGCLLSARLYTKPNNSKKIHTEGKNLEGKMLTKLEATEATPEKN